MAKEKSKFFVAHLHVKKDLNWHLMEPNKTLLHGCYD
jgi:hypothetical protein